MTRTTTMFVFAMSLSFGCGGGDGGAEEDDQTMPDDEDDGDDGDDEQPTSGRCSVERAGPPVDVVFHDEAGVPLMVVKTDGDGVAAFDDCVPDGMVTLVNPVFLGGGGGKVNRLMTVQGVQIGDHVLFDPPQAPSTVEGALTVTVQNSDDLVSDTPDHYVASIGDCTLDALPLDDDHGGEIQIPNMTADCRGYDASNYSIVSIARDAEDNPLALARVDSDDLANPVTANGGTWVAYDGASALAIENRPSDLNGFLVVSPLIDGMLFARDYQSFDEQDAVLEVEYWPAAIAEEHRVAIGVGYGDGISSSTRIRTADAPPTSLDMASDLFAPPSQLILDVVDPTRPRVGWQGSDERVVLTRSEITWTFGEDQGAWIVVTPGNSGETVVPLLPGDVDATGPVDGAQTLLTSLLQIDKGIDYSAWLSGGLTSSLYGDSLAGVPETREEEGMTIRQTVYEAP